MNGTIKLLILSSLIVVAACKEDGATTDLTVPPALTPEEQQVIANCHIVEQAAEAFAAENGGLYPDNIELDQSLAGNTLLDLLPGGTHLVNPITGFATEPVDGNAATLRGETSYGSLSSRTGYTVTGQGESEMIYQFQK